MRSALLSGPRWLLASSLWFVACTSANPPSQQAKVDAARESLDDDAGSDAGAPSDAAVVDLDAQSSLDAQTRDAAPSAQDAAPVTPFVCMAKDPPSCPTPPTTYSDVQPIFAKHCLVCHSPLWTGPWPLDQYEHLVDWQDTIRTDMLNCSMPLRDGGLPITITLEERETILSFIRCGLPQ